MNPAKAKIAKAKIANANAMAAKAKIAKAKMANVNPLHPKAKIAKANQPPNRANIVAAMANRGVQIRLYTEEEMRERIRAANRK